MENRSIILFDGVCNLCNSAVQFVIQRDKRNNFLFASLQSTPGQELLQSHHLPAGNISSFVLVENRNIYLGSTGALRVAKKLNGIWPLLYIFIIVPKFIRDRVYYWIAKNRYKWFGKKNECMVPTPALKASFLE
jgi:predicted DCC family thiol-disulfide oxidoreductase YuxK